MPGSLPEQTSGQMPAVLPGQLSAWHPEQKSRSSDARLSKAEAERNDRIRDWAASVRGSRPDP